MADPHDDRGDPDGLRVLLDAHELTWADRQSIGLKHALRNTQRRQPLNNLALKALHPVHGDVEKIARPAGGIKHGDVAQGVVKRLRQLTCLAKISLPLELIDLDARCFPLVLQHINDGRLHQRLDHGFWRVMRSKLAPLLGGQGIFHERAKDRRLDLRPVAGRSLTKNIQLTFRNRDRRVFGIQAAIVPEHVASKDRAVTPCIHRAKHLTDRLAEVLRCPLIAFQELAKGSVRD